MLTDVPSCHSKKGKFQTDPLAASGNDRLYQSENKKPGAWINVVTLLLAADSVTLSIWRIYLVITLRVTLAS